MPNAKFPLGQLRATPGATAALKRAEQDSGLFLDRHAAGDWGEVDTSGWRANEDALKHGGRLLSRYSTKRRERIYIITTADRSATTLRLLGE